MEFTLCHAAGDMFMPAVRRRRVVKFAAIHGDIFTLSEVIKDHDFIASVKAVDSYVVGELGIGWDASRFEKVEARYRQVMRGGRRGALRRTRRDRRRRGPSRGVARVLLRDIETREWVLAFTHHAIAKGDTKHKWRRPLRRQGFLGVVREIKRAQAKYPDVPIILTGDLNTIRWRILVFARAGLRQVKTPATFGRLRYDRIYVSKDVKVSGIKRERTAGDHKALIATITTKEVA